MTARIGSRFWLKGHPEVVGVRNRLGAIINTGQQEHAAQVDQFDSERQWRAFRIDIPDLDHVPRFPHREYAELSACLAVLTLDERSAFHHTPGHSGQDRAEEGA